MKRFMHGTELARFQDNLIKEIKKDRYEYVSEEKLNQNKKTAEEMDRNLWIKLSNKIAPSNLVLRHYCIMDILNDSPDNFEKIYRLISLLSPCSSNGRLWLEGYSYWIFCKTILTEYVDHFSKKYKATISIPLSLIILEIDNCFQKTSYEMNGYLCPAPFGSVRIGPLEDHLQDKKMSVINITIYPVKKLQNKYVIRKSLLGFNSHIPDKNNEVIISNSCIHNFSFYHGFEEKYESKYEEIKDMIRFDKIMSAIKLLFK